MIINVELANNELFIDAMLSNDGDKSLIEKKIANYLVDNIKPTYEYYLFLCDETWSEASKSIMYKGLWKQEQNRLYFEKYNLAKEYSFFKNDNKQVMFASCFKIFEDDIAQAIKINANQISKHSFLFLTENGAFYCIKKIPEE